MVTTHLFVRLLGEYGVEVDGWRVPSEAWRPRRALELVELLALHPRHRLHRDQVIDALWPHLPVEAGARNLHKAAHFVRRILRAPEAIVLRRGYVELWPGACITTDVEAFQAKAGQALAAGDPSSCRSAAALYGGELLPDQRYEDWAAGPREQLRRLLVDVLRRGRLWQQVMEHEPGDEHAHRALLQEFDHPPAVRPPIRYVRNAGVHVAYQVVGDAIVDLLVIPGWVSHLALDWEDPAWVRWCERLTSFARVIRFDKPGTGLSDRPTVLPRLEARMRDALCVLDAAGSPRAHVLAWRDGGPLAIVLATHHPQRVASLMLFATQACFHRGVDYPWGRTAQELERSLDETTAEWGGDRPPSLAVGGDERFVGQWAAYQRAAASPASAASLVRANHQIDVRAILGEVHTPTLVLSRRGDPIVPPAATLAMAEAIPGARVVELDGDEHLMWLGDAETSCAEIERFVCGVDRSASAAPPPVPAGKVSGRSAS